MSQEELRQQIAELVAQYAETAMALSHLKQVRVSFHLQVKLLVPKNSS